MWVDESGCSSSAWARRTPRSPRRPSRRAAPRRGRGCRTGRPRGSPAGAAVVTPPSGSMLRRTCVTRVGTSAGMRLRWPARTGVGTTSGNQASSSSSSAPMYDGATHPCRPTRSGALASEVDRVDDRLGDDAGRVEVHHGPVTVTVAVAGLPAVHQLAAHGVGAGIEHRLVRIEQREYSPLAASTTPPRRRAVRSITPAPPRSCGRAPASVAGIAAATPSAHQLRGEAVVFRRPARPRPHPSANRRRRHVDPRPRVGHTGRRAQHHGRDGVVARPANPTASRSIAITSAVSAGRQHTDVVEAQHRRATDRRQRQRLAGAQQRASPSLGATPSRAGSSTCRACAEPVEAEALLVRRLGEVGV